MWERSGQDGEGFLETLLSIVIIIIVIIIVVVQGLTVLCGSSTVRLVSSGNFVNTVTVLVKVIINIQQSQNNVWKTIQ